MNVLSEQCGTALILSGHKRALVASELLQAAEEVSRG